MAGATDTRTNGAPADRPEGSRGADAVLADDSQRGVIVDLLATAATDLLLEEVERELARRDEDEPSTN